MRCLAAIVVLLLCSQAAAWRTDEELLELCWDLKRAIERSWDPHVSGIYWRLCILPERLEDADTGWRMTALPEIRDCEDRASPPPEDNE